ncbi:MAG: hypothetical protein I8N66_27350, partial [Ensifer sp. SSB1]|nr:hypothetical protein [Ensifer sp. SSB1]
TGTVTPMMTGTVTPMMTGTAKPAADVAAAAEVSTIDAEPVFKRTPVPEKRLDPKAAFIQ